MSMIVACSIDCWIVDDEVVADFIITMYLRT